MNLPSISIFWCRRDFRIEDNFALLKALEHSKANNIPFLPLFILDDDILKQNIGYPRKLMLSKVLAHYTSNFKTFEVICGQPVDILWKISQNAKICVFANEDIEPYSIKREKNVNKMLKENDSTLIVCNDQMSVDKNILAGSGNFYSVFSPFRKAVINQFLLLPSIEKNVILSLLSDVQYGDIDHPNFNFQKIKLNGKSFEEIQEIILTKMNGPWLVINNTHQTSESQFEIDLDTIFERPLYQDWYYTEDHAVADFNNFVSTKISHYKEGRDDLAGDTLDGGQTSKMSVALKWGLVSSRMLRDQIIKKHGISSIEQNENIFAYISELIWREFYKYILLHRPTVLNQEFQPKFVNAIEWVPIDIAQSRFMAWIKGETGYDLVDAAMQQIRQTGWMHNRARMLVASVLTKNLGVDWRWGQSYFRAVLLDLDEASNNGGWQWAASVGADPKPIRIFNPYLQAQKYDTNGSYRLKWLPKNYDLQLPIIDHKKARDEALRRYGYEVKGEVRDY